MSPVDVSPRLNRTDRRNRSTSLGDRETRAGPDAPEMTTQIGFQIANADGFHRCDYKDSMMWPRRRECRHAVDAAG